MAVPRRAVSCPVEKALPYAVVGSVAVLAAATLFALI